MKRKWTEFPPNWESICGWRTVASGIEKVLNLSVTLHTQAGHMLKTSWQTPNRHFVTFVLWLGVGTFCVVLEKEPEVG